jgi:triacylglycerol lipase
MLQLRHTWALTITAFALGCGSAPSDGYYSDFAPTTPGAGGSADHGTVASTSTTGDGSGGDGTVGPVKKGPPYPIVLAHGFFGFDDFAGQNFISYFYGVKDQLAKEGETVYTPAVDPFNDSDYRGAQLAAAIEDILAKTGYAKVNIIGHSQGGLDARVVAHDHPDWVASITTISTPHRGTPVADVALKLVSDPNLQGVLDWVVKTLGKPLWDKDGNETSVWKPLKLFSQPGIAAFNAKYPDPPGIAHFSVAGRSNYAGMTAACTPDVPFALTTDNSMEDPLDALFGALEPTMSGDYNNENLNDGLVRVPSARWGRFLGCVPADHLDEIGQLLGDTPGVGNDFDYQRLYRELVKFVRSQGY